MRVPCFGPRSLIGLRMKTLIARRERRHIDPLRIHPLFKMPFESISRPLIAVSRGLIFALGIIFHFAQPGSAQEESKATSDAQEAQNPIANIISVPFQNNTYLNYGPYRSDANILVIQPVLPFA